MNKTKKKFFNINFISHKKAKLSLLINYFLKKRLLIYLYKFYYLISNKKSILSYPQLQKYIS